MLIVASEARERELLANRLHRAGHHAIAVEHGEAAVRALTDAADAAAITALLISEPLPDGPTAPLVRYARSLPELTHVLIVVLAADAGAAHAAALYDAGADVVATKPVDFDLLSRQIAALRRSAA
jgi:DNA-binding response OmpR family regulator